MMREKNFMVSEYSTFVGVGQIFHENPKKDVEDFCEPTDPYFFLMPICQGNKKLIQ